MVVVESWFSRRVFGKPIETHLLARLSRVSVVVLALFLALRLRDLAIRDAFSSLFPLSFVSWMFFVEVGLGVVLPMVLLASAKFRESPRRLAMVQGIVVLGFILHRLNVSVTAVEAATGQSSLPSLPEFVLSMGIVALGMLIFCLACLYLPVFPEGEMVRVGKKRGATDSDEVPRGVVAVDA